MLMGFLEKKKNVDGTFILFNVLLEILTIYALILPLKHPILLGCILASDLPLYPLVLQEITKGIGEVLSPPSNLRVLI